ncbi:LysM peptidoglycan-binding domain-containing protein [Aerococcaceae bacterium DSM 109653]|uniref:LysM peptidoglycan-binding domain-containing protein n=1 Tax=Fundicoccus ignavus TaxID=2664442 RepID=A0A844BTC7_9LACT|nr:LysM peptidoglycan-binding domain-containing protein [Fundicoccus ignavus]MRI80779.1 LysM peptidoglycan-binding domain-containing protein [Fundicoccus ignavus]
MKKLMRKSKGSWLVVTLGAAMLSLNGPVVNAEETVNETEHDVTIETTLKQDSQVTASIEQSTENVPAELELDEMSQNSPTDLLSDTLSDSLNNPVEASDSSTPEATDNFESEAPQEDAISQSLTEPLIETEIQPEAEAATQEINTLKVHTLTATAETPAKTHTVKSGEYLYLIAERYGITVAQLKQWNNLTSNYIYSGDQLKVSAGTATTKPGDTHTTKPTDNTQTTNSYYTVRPGDYLWKIANQHGITVAQLKTWNNLTSNYIYSGDRFIVSKTTTTPTQPEKPVESKPETPKEPDKPSTSQPTPSTPTPTYYTVKSGDYLWKIATQYGITVNQLKSWNKLTSNYIYSGDKLAVTDPTKVTTPTTPEPEKPVEPEKPTEPTKPEEPSTPVEPTQPAAKYHTVKSGEYLWLIANQNNITVNQLKSWNKLTSNYIYSGDRLIVTDPTKTTPTPPTTPTEPNLPEGTLTGTHSAVQAVLNQYKNSPIHVFYESLVEDDLRTASLNGDTAMYGASVPKIVLVAYTLEQVEKGNLSWDTPLKYTSKIYNYNESYAWGGSGTIQYENYQNKTYTLRDVLNRTIVNSDNLGSNMLLHYVGYRDKSDFNRFTKEVYGAPSYTRNMTPREINKVMAYIYEHPQQQAMTSLDRTDYDKTKLDTVSANVFQKIGAWWPYYNHSTAIVESSRPYIVTVLSDYWSDSSIATLAKKIFTAVMS